MPAERRYGMDHQHYDWSPVVTREALRWPKGARVALCVIVNLEHLEWSPAEGSFQTATLYDRPLPDYRNYSHREYGHRVGIFRVLDTLEKHGIRPTVAMDALTAENYPYLVKHCLQRGCEIIGHGMSVSRMITSKMSEEEERRYIRESIEALTHATGSAPRGWLGPEYGESVRTPQLLAEAGIGYVCDWANDEQPYAMKVPQGELYALPIMLDMDDVFALKERRFPVDDYAELLKEGFDTIYGDATDSGRLLVLNLHPWLIGQPFRIGYLDDALGHMVRRQGVWAASGGEIIDWYRKPGSA
ncbi:MAG: polysaccharide deacetylase family protein [Chloroflexi bacterium]|nr:polysaccharide deacetylase family protein [Chloroflexota bacterium]